MSASVAFVSPSDAARRLGLSVKALRLYEAHGLLHPLRTGAGWRAYGPDDMARASEIGRLRGLGLGLAQISAVLGGDPSSLEVLLAAHERTLEDRIRNLVRVVAEVRGMRNDPAVRPPPGAPARNDLPEGSAAVAAVLDLPWPWGGERFEVQLAAVTYLTGPLGCGKTRLARRLAETLPNAVFLGLDRAADGAAVARGMLAKDEALRRRVDDAARALTQQGAAASDALCALLVGLETEGAGALIVDMVEEGLDPPTQRALIARLRRRGSAARTLVLMTRSTDVLDLGEVGPGEAILYCPANHSPPFLVVPHPGARGYEAVATCLAPTWVRARTATMRLTVTGPG